LIGKIFVKASLDQQFNRLPELEKKVMYWLAENRRFTTLPELQQGILPQASHRELLEALESLQQRSLYSWFCFR